MSDSHTRGRWQVPRQSWLWRCYASWARRKNDTRTIVDLCHFTRVLLIFGPWRWFWQARYLGVIRPCMVAVAPAILAGSWWVFTTYSEPILWGAWIMVRVLFVMAIAGAAIYGVIRWLTDDTERRERWVEKTFDAVTQFFGYALWPVWYCVQKIGHGIAWLWDHGVGRALHNTFGKPLFYMRIGSAMIGVWIYVFFAAAAYTALVYFFPLIVLSISVTLLVMSALIIGSLVTINWAIERNKQNRREQVRAAQAAWDALSFEEKMRLLHERENRKLAEAAKKKPVKAEKPPREWRTVKLFWGWLVAKKHRVCPLIEPTDGPFEPPKTPTYV